MDLKIPAADGFPLAASLFGEPPSARALLVVNGATAVPRGFYKSFAEHFASKGYLVLTYDYRGMGDSVPRPDAKMHEWGALDMTGILRWAQKEHASLPLVGVGHSAGGQLLCIAEGAERYRALVGVAAQSGYWKHWPAPLRYRRWLDWHVAIPGVATTFGHVPGWLGLGEHLPKDVAREWAHWCRHPEYILRDDTERRREGFARLKLDFLSFSFSDDTYGPEAAADWLARQYVNARVTRRHLTPRDAGVDAVGHFGYFRPKVKDTLWRETEAFLNGALGR